MLFRNSKLLIGALTKNSGNWIVGVLKNIEMYASCFQDYKCLLVDGNSVDSTKVIMKSWAKSAPTQRIVIDESVLFESSDKAVNDRGNILANARNAIIDVFRQDHSFSDDNTFLLLLDTDSVNSRPFDISQFMTCERAFETNPKCAGVFANQPKVYYDVWALRDKQCPIDWQIEWRLCGDVNCHKKYQTRKAPELGLWPVKSAFGGAGLYRTSKIPTNAKYICTQVWKAPIGIDYTIPVCEHVPFNEKIVEAGYQLYINCEWLICDHE